ncbi:MAG TPA: hypothetical protein VKA08_17705 [Balneolales bacterium]|jgi:hypothetical protein|nr:hypothetical protein [Balneolales bacterium]
MDTIEKRTLKKIVLTASLAVIMIVPVAGMAQNTHASNPFFQDTTNTNEGRDTTAINNRHEQTEPQQPETNTGDWALMFQIDQNFTLKDFSGALISFQKTLSNRNAVRWGLSLNGGYNEQKNNPPQKTTTGKFHIGVYMNYLWYAHINHEIRFYYGLGPTVSVGYNHTKDSQNSGINIMKQNTLSEGVGLEGVAGVEWFVRPRISLLAEYVPALTGKYTSTTNKTLNTASGVSTRSKTSTTDIHFGSLPVRFGVSVYF